MRGGEKPGVCASEDCIHHVRALGIDVGRSPSPCESFGRFVCSGWKTSDREFANTVPRQVALEWILRVEKMSLRDFDRDAVVNRPLIMMRKCMRHTADEKDAVASLIAMVESSSLAWPTQDEESETPVIDYSRALRLLLELSVLWALPLWFRVRMLPATAHFQRDRAIVLSPSGLASTWQVFHETLLCYDDAYPIYLSYFNAIKKLAAEDWVQAFRSLYSPSHNVTANDLLLATNGGLLKAVGSIFALNTAQDILFHTIWWFVQSVGIAASNELISAVTKHSDSMYFRQISLFSAHERLSIARHLESVRTVAVEKLRSYSKISDASKRALSNVLEDMSTVIWPEEDFGRPGGFAEYYGQPYRGEDGFLGEWLWSHLQLQNSEAAAAGSHDYVAASKIYHTGSDRMMSYNPILNTMSVSLSAMRPPFYYREATSAVIYGGLGFLYAQAIFDALADIAHLLHGDVVTQPSDAMTTTWSFWNASWCQHPDNRLAYPEIPALDVAYTAYIRFRDEASDLPLKGLPCCTPKQVFFATMCHCSCYVGSSKTKQSRVCEVAVKNFEAFSETFSCPLGSSMNTYPKCVYA
ncbi:hypothetical protein HPB49_011848 [Dermacentor silvarum]|uniref:Uncharacterized protein n=1 Tax=Dermacentor silvarum TaxID=543639 RepID=A0ACB8D5E2_DERSI|nr:hypothetical protein HPB49_011848 [Dermacentor silvarum]